MAKSNVEGVFTPAGNLKVAYKDEFKAKVVEALGKVFDIEKAPNGNYGAVIFTDPATGKSAYVDFKIVVSATNPMDKAVPKKKTSTSNTVSAPTLPKLAFEVAAEKAMATEEVEEVEEFELTEEEVEDAE